MAVIRNAADALSAYVRVKAAEHLIKEETQRLHTWLRDEASRIGEETGTATTIRAKGVGSAGWSEPSWRVQVSDESAFGAWCQQSGHPVRERVEVDCSILQHDLDSADDRGAGVWLALQEAGYLRQAWSLSHDLLTVMESWPVHLGGVVSPDGEPVPGVRLLPRSSPSFRVTPDASRVRQVQAELRAALAGVLELPERVEQGAA